MILSLVRIVSYLVLKVGIVIEVGDGSTGQVSRLLGSHGISARVVISVLVVGRSRDVRACVSAVSAYVYRLVSLST